MRIYVAVCTAALLLVLGTRDLLAGQEPGHSGMTAVPVQLGTVVSACAPTGESHSHDASGPRLRTLRSEVCMPCQSDAGTVRVSIRLDNGAAVNVNRTCASALAVGDKVWVVRGRSGADQVVKALQ